MALAVLGIIRGSRLKSDAALGAVLTVFFGFGAVLLTKIQSRGNAGQSGLDSFLFGQAALLLQRDVVQMSVLGGLSLGVVAILYKEFKLLSFDPEFGVSLGLPMGRLSVLLTGLTTIAVVIGLQTVGVVLMAAMLVAPAAAARQWTDRLGRMIVLSALFGAVSGVSGPVLSSLDTRMPTGPLVVLIATSIAFVSLAIAPRRGLLWTALQRRRNRQRLVAAFASGRGAWRTELARDLNVPESQVHLRPEEVARVLSPAALDRLESETDRNETGPRLGEAAREGERV